MTAKFKPQYFDDKLFRALIENISDAIALLDENSRVLYISPSAVRVLGYSPEEVVGRIAFDFIHPEDLDKIQTLLSQVLKKPGESISAEYRLIHKDGSWRWFEGVATNLLYLPNVQAIVATYHDITKRKENQEALMRSEARLRRLIDSNIVGVMLVETQKILEANDAFLKIVGYTRKDLKEGKLQWRKLTPPEYMSLTLKHLEEIKRNGSCPPFEKEYIRKDGTRVPILIGKALLQKEPFEWVSFVVDLTDRKELEDRKDAFISMASHELKTPVTTIKVFNQLLQQKYSQVEDAATLTYLLKMDDQINRLTELVEDLLDLSKIQSGQLSLKREPFYMNDLVDETVEYLQELFPSHKIHIIRNDAQKISADKHRIEQVLINLISNAIKYSPGADQIIISSAMQQESLVVAVRDFGIGIAKKDQKNLFDRFYRVQEEKQKTYPGLGIGLYISNEIVIRHGGKIWFESSRNKGSTFYFSTPVRGRTQSAISDRTKFEEDTSEGVQTKT